MYLIIPLCIGRSLRMLFRATLPAALVCLSFVTAARLHAANHSVAASMAHFTLDGNITTVNPGDTITLASGTHGRITIKNISGTASNPIVIRNTSTGGVAVIDGQGDTSSWNGALTLVDVEHVIIDGSKNSAHDYGIRLTSSVAGHKNLIKFFRRSRFSTLRYVELDGANKTNVGISINDDTITVAAYPGFTREGYKFEHNHLHDILHEGMYLGHNYDAANPRCPVRNMEIAHNLVEEIGWEGINLKDCPDGNGNNRIHHNTVIRAGKVGSGSGQRSGIQLANAYADVYNNWVGKAGHDGIRRWGAVYPSQSMKIYNNVVIYPGFNADAGAADLPRGINISQAPAVTIYNNTIIKPPGDGISIDPLSGTARNNIVAEAGETPVIAQTASHNSSGLVDSMKFAGAAADNFHLLFNSPAVNTGSTALFAATDYDGVSRGSTPDRGAFEFVSGGGGSSITFRAKSSANTGTSTATSLAISKPTGVVSGDVMIMGLSVGSTATATAPAGWTLIRTINDGFVMRIYWKAAGSSEPSSYTWTLDQARKMAGGIVAFDGVNASAPIQVENGAAHTTAASTIHTTPSISTSGSSTWLVSVFGDRMVDVNPSTWIPPAGSTEQVDARTTGSGSNVSIAINTQGPVSAGSKSHTSTGSASSAAAGMEIIAIKP